MDRLAVCILKQMLIRSWTSIFITVSGQRERGGEREVVWEGREWENRERRQEELQKDWKCNLGNLLAWWSDFSCYCRGAEEEFDLDRGAHGALFRYWLLNHCSSPHTLFPFLTTGMYSLILFIWFYTISCLLIPTGSSWMSIIWRNRKMWLHLCLFAVRPCFFLSW